MAAKSPHPFQIHILFIKLSPKQIQLQHLKVIYFSINLKMTTLIQFHKFLAAAPTLHAPPLMLSPIKLLDETLTACDGPLDYLMDQTDFLVVGIMGSQCAGKSYILSELAGR
jgi:hypothetical protein